MVKTQEKFKGSLRLGVLYHHSSHLLACAYECARVLNTTCIIGYFFYAKCFDQNDKCYTFLSFFTDNHSQFLKLKFSHELTDKKNTILHRQSKLALLFTTHEINQAWPIVSVSLILNSSGHSSYHSKQITPLSSDNKMKWICCF